MKKENVFLVTTRPLHTRRDAPSTHGVLQQNVFCAATEEQLHKFLKSAMPHHTVVGVASYAALEATLGQIKAALARAPGTLQVYVDPALNTTK